TMLTTISGEGRVYIAPMGIIADGDGWIVAPFRPSSTLDNLRTVPFAVANYTDDVRIFAGCLTGRQEWPTTASDHVPVPRLTGGVAYLGIGVAKPAGAHEAGAWSGLMDAIRAHYASPSRRISGKSESQLCAGELFQLLARRE